MDNILYDFWLWWWGVVDRGDDQGRYIQWDLMENVDIHTWLAYGDFEYIGYGTVVPVECLYA